MDWRDGARAGTSRYVSLFQSGRALGDMDIARRQDGQRGAGAQIVGSGSYRGPNAKVIVPSTTSLPLTLAFPASTPIRLRSRFTITSITTTSPGCTGLR